jgi:hypothetical protein
VEVHRRNSGKLKRLAVLIAGFVIAKTGIGGVAPQR